MIPVWVFKILIRLVVLAYVFSWNVATDPKLYPSHELLRVYDGDTVVLKDVGSVRLVGLDTPEKRRVGYRYRGEFASEAERFTERFLKGERVHVHIMGRDRYGRSLGHLLNEKGWLNYSLLANGLARVYFFRDTMDFRTYFLAHAYRTAFHGRKGIFSEYGSAPVLREGSRWKRYLGKIVWLECDVRDYHRVLNYNDLDCGWALVAVRDEEYEVMFGGFLDFDSLVGKRIRAFGELYEFHGRPYILVRMPFELEVMR